MVLRCRSAMRSFVAECRARQPFHLHAIRLCHGASAASNDPHLEESKLASAMQHHRRLAKATATSMAMPYFRGEYYNAVQKWFRQISVDVSYDFRRWRSHQSPWRNAKLWSPRRIVGSDNIRRLVFPDLTAVCVVSSSVCYYNAFGTQWFGGEILYLPFECFSLTSVALGLLVTFKTQTSYARFIEGRSLWGLTINESRALSSRILSRMNAATVSDDGKLVVQIAQQHAVKLVRSFAFTLKYHLTEDGCNPHISIKPDSKDPEVQRAQDAQLKEALSIALKAELYQIWDINDAEERAFVDRIHEASNRPLQVLHEISLINGEVFANPNLGNLDHPCSTEMDRSIRIFHNILGACEKILRTPIYSPYSKFTCRFLTVWCSTLPLALYPILGLGTVPASITISFFMLGIEDIGSRVEQPFNCMPLWQYCQTVDTSCIQIVRSTESHWQRKSPKVLDSADDDDRLYESDFEDGDLDFLKSWGDPLDITEEEIMSDAEKDL